MKTTTLNNIKKKVPCEDGWVKLLKSLGKTKADDELLTYANILSSNGLDDAIWCCSAESKYDKDWRLFAVFCAMQMQHQMDDGMSLKALDTAEQYAKGMATDAELSEAGAAAGKAARSSTCSILLAVATVGATDVVSGVAARVSSNTALTSAGSEFPSARGIQDAEFLCVINVESFY